MTGIPEPVVQALDAVRRVAWALSDDGGWSRAEETRYRLLAKLLDLGDVIRTGRAPENRWDILHELPNLEADLRRIADVLRNTRLNFETAVERYWHWLAEQRGCADNLRALQAIRRAMFGPEDGQVESSR